MFIILCTVLKVLFKIAVEMFNSLIDLCDEVIAS